MNPRTEPAVDTAPSLAAGLRRLFATRRAALLVVLLAAAVSVPLGLLAARWASAQEEARPPCPADAPVRHFDVLAIDVDIPLNAFGNHDPAGKMYVLAEDLDDVRDQEASQEVTPGLHDDPIQPLMIRANMGECVVIDFTNQASGGPYGLHIDGLVVDRGSAPGVGHNTSTSVSRGETRAFRFYVPNEPTLEGARYLHPGPGHRRAISHGLFGGLVVEPPGSVYLHPETLEPIRSGWEAVIDPEGAPAFREAAQAWSETGDEDDDVHTADGGTLPTVDPTTDSYRPGGRQISYRAEPFLNRLDEHRASGKEATPELKAEGYSSYSFGDPATPIPRSYLGDPMKIRILHGGSEVFHVFHLHGGSIRWPKNPHADTNFDYADTGLNKHPETEVPDELQQDSQTFGPGESFDLQITGGAGGLQQSPGDFLYHCHISDHYVSGMWSLWRVLDTRQPDLAPLPDREPPPPPVASTGLIGETMPDGTTLTADNLDEWITPQLPPQGTPHSDTDPAVWDWTVEDTDAGPQYLGEPVDRGPWPNLDPDHPGLRAVDVGELVDDRPPIWFNPTNGRPTYPLLRPQIGRRPPFAPNGHSGAPWLGEHGDQEAESDVDPWAGRDDAVCPSGSPERRFDLAALQLPIQVTDRETDDLGQIYARVEDTAAMRSGDKPVEPLAIRANVGDCVRLTLVSEQEPTGEAPHPAANIHVHHVQFDIQGSDGVITGFNYEQAVRPYKRHDPRLVADAAAGDTVLALEDVGKFHEGAAIGVGLGTPDLEVRTITAIDPGANTVTLDRALGAAHPTGQWAGTEFVQYQWFPDILLDNVFFHDHVDAIHSLGHGLAGQLLVEPRESTYRDPATGEQISSGTIADIHTDRSLAPGVVDGSFREFVVFQIDGNPVTDSTINLKAEPLGPRGSDRSLAFSSYAHGDPFTPLPRAYPGDPFVIRLVNIGPSVDIFHLSGHRFRMEPRRRDTTIIDSVTAGVSERFTLVLDGGAGGTQQQPGDYLYANGIGRRLQDGAWGLLRVLPGSVDDLQPLPGHPAPPPTGEPRPEQTGERPPEPPGPGQPCPTDAPVTTVAVSAVDLPLPLQRDGLTAVFVPTDQADEVRAGDRPPEPLVLHVTEGECLEVEFTNERVEERASLHLNELLREPASAGVNEGFNPESTVAPGESRTYRLYADTHLLGSALLNDLASESSNLTGLYGAAVVHEPDATITDPLTGEPTRVGTRVDVHVPNPDEPDYRDFTLALADDDPQIGTDFMPYPEDVSGPAVVNYHSEPLDDRDGTGTERLSSRVNRDPRTPILSAYAGDPVRIHSLVAPGSEQIHALHFGGLASSEDYEQDDSQTITTRAMGPFVARDDEIHGGAGGHHRATGDFLYGDNRRAFTEAGMWGLIRVLSDPACPIQPLPGLDCTGQASLITGAVPQPFEKPPEPPPAEPEPEEPPPAEEPPPTEEPPPADEPPAEQPPPADEPPAEQPPPADEPPSDEPPADEPTAPTETLVCSSDAVPPASFTDRHTIPQAHQLNVDCAAWQEIVVGFTDGTYRPAVAVRRDQMATFVAGTLTAAGVELPPASEQGFDDVPADSPHAEAINQLAAAGVIEGGPGQLSADSYGPSRLIRRDQIASFLVRAAALASGEDLASQAQAFPDVGPDNAHFANINGAAEVELARGFDDGTYRPGANVRRDQMATFVIRLLER